MSVQSFLPTSSARPSRSEPLAQFLAAVTRFRARLQRKAALQHSIRELETLTDHELTDIGLTRAHIRSAVHTGRT